MANLTDKQKDEIRHALRYGKPLPEIDGLVIDFSQAHIDAHGEPFRLATKEEQDAADALAKPYHDELKRRNVTPTTGRRPQRTSQTAGTEMPTGTGAAGGGGGRGGAGAAAVPTA